jgi:pteridine reductase
MRPFAAPGAQSASARRRSRARAVCARLPESHRIAKAAALEGRIVLITGGAKRVGAAICRRLHKAGASIMLHYRASAGEARLLQAELNHVRRNSVALIQADLLDVGKLPSLVEQTVQTYGKLDALINNASTFYPTTIGEIAVDDWNDLIGTNLEAPLFLSQAAAPALRKTQGAIVNITDIHAERPLKSYVVYSVAKAGLVGLTRSLARELAPDVRVNAVAPGPILWPDEEVFDELARQRIISHTPLRREGTPDDIAKAVHYLLAEAPYVTGETINVDGGRHIAL